MIEDVKAVRVIDEVPKQDIVLQEKMIVISVFYEKKPILQ